MLLYLENFEYNFNLNSTLSYFNKQAIDYSNSISLMDIVCKFNKLYIESKKELIEIFNKFKNNILININNTVLRTKIEGDLNASLTDFEFCFGSTSIDLENFIKVNFSLGNNFKIKSSIVVLGGNRIVDEKEKNDIVQKLLNEVYINKSQLPDYYSRSESSKKKL